MLMNMWTGNELMTAVNKVDNRFQPHATSSFPQESTAGLSLQDPDEPQHVSAVPQHGLPAGRLASKSG